MEQELALPSLIMGEDVITLTITYSPSTRAVNMKPDKPIGVPELIAVLTSITHDVAMNALQQSQMIIGAGGDKPKPGEEAKDGNTEKDNQDNG